MDIVIGGMPRGGTTVAAKFYSLHEDFFCYAGETHCLPLLFDLVGVTPCIEEQVGRVAEFMRHQLIGTMVDMIRYSVEQGAHKGNLIFSHNTVDAMMSPIVDLLRDGLTGKELYERVLEVMTLGISSGSRRPIIGEKTPSNVFSMADYGRFMEKTLSLVVVREPFGALRSMRGRVAAADNYSSVFDGCLESNLGIYLEYGRAIQKTLKAQNSMLVQFEEMANAPGDVLTRMYGYWGRTPDERAINFVENGNDPEVADRAPMCYRRLQVRHSDGVFSTNEAWKILALTRSLRESFGYTDDFLADIGWDIPTEWMGEFEESTLFPLDGFFPPNEEGALHMRKKGALVAYFGKGNRHVIGLKFWSSYPEFVDGDVIKLTITVNGRIVGELCPGTGPSVTCFDYEFTGEDMQPMNEKNNMVVIELEASHTFSPMASVLGGDCADNRSVLLYDYSVESF